MTDSYPKFKVAAVQAEPVPLDREATVHKACSLIEEAGRNGARVIAFPESFIPGHPEWLSFYPPGESMTRFYREFFKNSVEVPSAATEQLGGAAKKADAYVVIGINERVPDSMGSLYNSLLFLDPQGQVLGVHRKLVPTRTERFVHASGDGASLRVYPTRYGGLGGLMCGENTNSLARFALLAQGEKIHTAHWPSFPTLHSRDGLDGIDIRIRNHAYEGKIFVISSSAVFGKTSLEKLCKTEASRTLAHLGGSVSGIVNPYGKYIGGPLVDEEGIVYAEVDLELMIDAKTLHDVVGNYNRFDVLSLVYTRRSPKPLTFVDEGGRDDLASLMRELLKKLEAAEASRPAAPGDAPELREVLARIAAKSEP